MGLPVSNLEIDCAIKNLVDKIGLKEPPVEDLSHLANKIHIQRCVDSIALHMGLGFDFAVSFVSGTRSSSSSKGFESAALARIERDTTYGIAAQVMVPSDLFIYGTLPKHLPAIEVRIADSATERPYTLIMVLAHELSHVLLKSLLHPRWDDELYADLVPMILGFSEYCRRGRKQVDIMRDRTKQITITTTYGYLSDAQFDFALSKISEMMSSKARVRKMILDKAALLRQEYHRLQKDLGEFRALLEWLDNNQKRSVRKEDVYKLVEYHSPDYTMYFEKVMLESEEIVNRSERYCRSPFHYNGPTSDRLKQYSRLIDSGLQAVRSSNLVIQENISIIMRNLNVLERLRYLFRSRLLSKIQHA